MSGFLSLGLNSSEGKDAHGALFYGGELDLTTLKLSALDCIFPSIPLFWFRKPQKPAVWQWSGSHQQDPYVPPGPLQETAAGWRVRAGASHLWPGELPRLQTALTLAQHQSAPAPWATLPFHPQPVPGDPWAHGKATRKALWKDPVKGEFTVSVLKKAFSSVRDEAFTS